MNWSRKLQVRIRALFQKRKLDAEMDEEMRSHIEMQTQENLDAGMSAEDARYAALRQFGWVESIKETCREHRGVSWIEHLIQDLRYGLRMLPQLRSGRAMDSGARQTHREKPRQRLQRHAARVGRQGRPSEIARRWHQLARCDRCVGPRRLPGLGDFGATRQPGSRRRNRLNRTDTQRV